MERTDEMTIINNTNDHLAIDSNFETTADKSIDLTDFIKQGVVVETHGPNSLDWNEKPDKKIK